MRKLIKSQPPTTEPLSSRLDVADFELMLKIGRSPNLSRAAQELGVSLSTVSRQLQALEAKIGQGLIRRGKRSIELTVTGTALADQAIAVLEHIAQVERGLLGAAQQSVLRIQGTFGFGRQFLSPIIGQYCRLNPQQRIQLELADRDPDLLDDRFDIAVRFGQPPNRAVIAKKLAPNRRFLVASPDYARSIAKLLKTPSDLEKVRCIALHQDNDRFSVWQLLKADERPKQEISIRVSAILASNHGEVVKQWAIEGLGVTLRSEFDVAPELANGALVRVLPDWQGSLGDIYAMYKPRKEGSDKHLSAVSANFLTFLQTSLKSTLLGM
jgi:LysR family transcriptional regulator, transcriptional activator for dmlA